MAPRRKKTPQMELFNTGADLPLFSGQAQQAPAAATAQIWNQAPEDLQAGAQMGMEHLPHIKITVEKDN